MNRGYNSTFDCVHPKREGRKTNEKTNRHKPFRNVNSATLSHTFTYSSRPGYAHIVKHWIKIIYVYIYIPRFDCVSRYLYALSLSLSQLLCIELWVVNCKWIVASFFFTVDTAAFEFARLNGYHHLLFTFHLLTWNISPKCSVNVSRVGRWSFGVFHSVCVCFFVCLCAAYKRFELELVDDDDNFVCLISTELYVSPLSAHWRNRQCEKNDNIIIIILNHINRIVA